MKTKKKKSATEALTKFKDFIFNESRTTDDVLVFKAKGRLAEEKYAARKSMNNHDCKSGSKSGPLSHLSQNMEDLTVVRLSLGTLAHESLDIANPFEDGSRTPQDGGIIRLTQECVYAGTTSQIRRQGCRGPRGWHQRRR